MPSRFLWSGCPPPPPPPARAHARPSPSSLSLSNLVTGPVSLEWEEKNRNGKILTSRALLFVRNLRVRFSQISDKEQDPTRNVNHHSCLFSPKVQRTPLCVSQLNPLRTHKFPYKFASRGVFAITFCCSQLVWQPAHFWKGISIEKHILS